MAEVDAIIAVYMWNYILPSGLMVLILKYFSQYIHSPYKIAYAWIVNRYVRLDRKTGQKKDRLFSSMANLNDDGRPVDILEIGVGGGTNFRYYPKRSNVICVDPNPYFEKYLRKNHSKFPHVNLKGFVIGTAENLKGIHDDSVDAVVCTLVLCSVDDLQKVLQEIKRVLRPGGQFYYMEHVLADKRAQPWVHKLQTFVRPAWKWFSDGCDFLNTAVHIEKAGFSHVDQEHFISSLKLKLIQPMLMGTATK